LGGGEGDKKRGQKKTLFKIPPNRAKKKKRKKWVAKKGGEASNLEKYTRHSSSKRWLHPVQTVTKKEDGEGGGGWRQEAYCGFKG